MTLIDRFHNMENNNNLFLLGREFNTPIWDIIRYRVFRNYAYPSNDRILIENIKARSKVNCNNILKILIDYIMVLFKKKNNIVLFLASRHINVNNKYYDKAMMPIIENINQEYTAIDSEYNNDTHYNTIYDLSNMFRVVISILYGSKYNSIFSDINNILIKEFGYSSITNIEFHNLLITYKAQLLFYKIILYFIKPRKIVISTGNPKALIKVAKYYNIESYLVQHGLIEKDEIDHSYPSSVRMDDYILYPDYLLTFGSYWCKNINVPCKKIITIGNDYYYINPKISKNNIVLFVSTIIHGRELKSIAKEYALYKNNNEIVFKLHPNEYEFKEYYKTYFASNKNVTVIACEKDTTQLVADSEIIILIVSAVLYEALQLKKRVAIYKRVNYKRQYNTKISKYLYYFNNVEELSKIPENIDYIPRKYKFYEKTKNEVIKNLFLNS